MLTEKHPEAKTKFKVLVVDDHPIMRQGLSQLLNQEPDLTVCAEADSASKALEFIDQLQPDLAIVDVSLRGSDGIELIKSIKKQHPQLPVLTLSMHDEALYAERALRGGARGYIMKQEGTDKVLVAIRRVMNGQIHVSDKIGAKMLYQVAEGHASSKGSPVERLSDRELEVFQLIGQGRGTRQIAESLHLSVKTVESHRAHIKEKLKLKTAPELAQHAIRWVQSHNGG